MTVSFKATPAERAAVERIAKRAVAIAADAGTKVNHVDIEMDLIATHANGCPLRLDDLENTNDFNLAHDVFGIRRHLDRNTGQLGGCFLPRFHA